MSINSYRRPSARPAAVGRRPYNPDRLTPVEQALDDLALFEEFKADILPKLREAIASNRPAAEIFEMGQAIAAARLVSLAALHPEANLGAIKELLDRHLGKSVERKAVVHKFDKLKDDEVDALLLSAVAESENADDDSDDK